MSVGMQSSNIHMRQIQTYVGTSRFVRVILAKGPCKPIPYSYNYIRTSPEGIQLVGGVRMRRHSSNTYHWWPVARFDLFLVQAWCVCARICFLIQPSPVFALSESFQNCETMRNTRPGMLELPTLRLTGPRSN